MEFELFNPRIFYELLRKRNREDYALPGDEWKETTSQDVRLVSTGRVALDSPLSLVSFSFNRWGENYCMNARFHTVDETEKAFFGVSPLIAKSFDLREGRKFQTTSADGVGTFLIYPNGTQGKPRVRAVLTKAGFSDDEVRIFSLGGFGSSPLRFSDYASFLREQQVLLDHCQTIVDAVYMRRFGENRAREISKRLIIPPYCSQE